MTLLESPTGTTLGLFLIQVVIVLTVVRFLGTTLRRIKQPMVIGEILAGICLGPSVLGWIPGFTDTFFPPQSMPYISLIAQVALIFFMFFLGMECDVKLMVSKWRSALPIAATSIMVPFFVGMGLSTFLIRYEQPEPESSVNYYLFMGISFSFTALPVLARILTGAGLVTHPLGVQALAAAAVDDVLAWCTLALVLSYVNGGGIVAGLGTAVITTVFVLFLVFLVRPLLGKIHKKLMEIDDELNSTFVFFIFVLLCIFSLFAEMAGIHAFFGAFIFGLVMPREGKFCDDFKPKLELLIVEFFLPLYFANSGIRTQIGALDSGELWGVAVLVCVVACVATIFPVAACTHLFNKNWRFCFAVGILMNTRGLIALIVINIGLDIGVLSARSFTLLILMALVTTFATSPLMHFFYISHLPKSEQAKHAQAAHDAHHASHSSVDPDKSLAALITNVMISERQIDQADAPPRVFSEAIEAAERAGQIRPGPAFEDEPSDLEMASPARNDHSVLMDPATPVSDSPAGLNAEQALEKWKQERAMRYEQHDRLDQH